MGWTTEIETRIATIRAAQRGEGQSLSEKQAFAPAGEWYVWYVGRHEENPGRPDIHLQNLTVSRAERSKLMHHRPAMLWFTGLPGAGKSTIANLIEADLNVRGIHTALLDGDNVRHGLNRDLGFTEADRVEKIRPVGEVAKLMTEAGLIVICSFISPFRAERRMVRELVGDDQFSEIYVDTPIEICVARDPKGLYWRAIAGEIKNFTGVDQPYEVPENPDLQLSAGVKDVDRLANEVIVHYYSERFHDKSILP